MDSIGIVIEQDAYGKYSAFRVVLVGGKLVEKKPLTSDRAMAYAFKEARDDVDRIQSGLARGTLKFTPKTIASVRSE